MGHEDEHNPTNNIPEIPSPPIISVPNLTSSELPLFCDLHRDAQKFYCQTCSKPVCGECGIHHHRGHITVNLMEAVEGAGIQANQVLKEAKLGILALREELDAVQVSEFVLEVSITINTIFVTLLLERYIFHTYSKNN